MSGTTPDKYFIIGDKSHTDRRFYINGTNGHVGINEISNANDALRVNGHLNTNSLSVTSGNTILENNLTVKEHTILKKNLTVIGDASFNTITLSKSDNTTDINAKLGNGKFGFSGAGDTMGIQHETLAVDGTNYAVKQNSSGQTSINATSGQRILFCNSNNTKMTIKNSGEVGIGTEDPSGDLHIYGNTDSHGSAIIEGWGENYSAFLDLKNTEYSKNNSKTGGHYKLKSYGGETENSIIRNGDFAIQQVPYSSTSSAAIAERFTISDAGNVGIGNTKPPALLSVDYRMLMFTKNNPDSAKIGGSNKILIGDYRDRFTTSATLENFVIQGGDNASQALIFTSGGSFQAQIRNIQGWDTLATSRDYARPISLQALGGNVGIGTTSPPVKLSVNSSNTTPNASGGISGSFALHNSTNGASLAFGVDSASDASSSSLSWIQSAYVNDSAAATNLAFYTGKDERMRITHDGKVGIGTDSPAQKLHVNGVIRGDSNILMGGSNFYNSGTYLNFEQESNDGKFRFKLKKDNSSIVDVFNIENNGNVGIGTGTGTNAPSARLHLKEGSITDTKTIFTTQTQYGSTNTGYFKIIENKFNSAAANWHDYSLKLQRRIDTTDQGYIEYGPDGDNYGLAIGSGTSEIIRFQNYSSDGTKNGNVGIGRTSPAAKLDVYGDFMVHSPASGIKFIPSSWVSSATGASNDAYDDVDFIANHPIDASDYISEINSHTDTTSTASTASHSHLQITGGNSKEKSIIITTGNAIRNIQGWNSSQLDTTTVSGTSTGNTSENISLQAMGGNVGIGTTSPSSLLSVSSATTTDITLLDLHSDAGANTTQTKIRLTKGTDYGGSIGGYLEQTVGSGLAFNTIKNTTDAERMRITSGGNVGIGTTSPNYTLDVDGSLNCTELRIGGTSLTNGDNRINASGIAGGGVTDAQFDHLSGARENIQDQLDDRALKTDIPNSSDYATTSQLNNKYEAGDTLQAGSTEYNWDTESRFKVKAQGTTSMYGIGAEYRLNSDRSKSLFLHAEAETNSKAFFGMGFNKTSENGNDHYIVLWSRNRDSGDPFPIGFFHGVHASQTYINNFTGQHPCIVNTDITEDSIGLIVSTTGNYLNDNNELTPSINESLPVCMITAIENDKKVFGVISNKEDESSSRTYGNGAFKSLYKRANNNERRVFINSVGEGSIWVCNKNGPIDNGDYISSSSIPGYGMKQTKNEDCLTNYTVAKITCDCDFNLTKIIKQKLKTETITDASDNENLMIIYDNSGNIQYEDDLDTNGLQQYIYKYDTRFIDEYGNIIQSETDYITRLNNGENVYISCFVGCTYHCG